MVSFPQSQSSYVPTVLKVGIVIILILIWKEPVARVIYLSKPHFTYDAELPPYKPVIDFPRPPKDSLRPLVLYAYAESSTARDNLAYFVAKGLNDAADFIFIFNGATDAVDLVPKGHENIRVIERENRCFDLGAMGRVLRGEGLIGRYKRFITLNASIRGPFLPVYERGKMCWMDAYLDRVTEVNKLVGMTLNCRPRPHVQSMIWATDDIGMRILNDASLESHAEEADTDWYEKPGGPVGLSACYEQMHAAVHAEIGATDIMLDQGYGVDVLMTSYSSYSSPEEYCENTGRPDDVLGQGKYFGSTVHPYETIFIKANRDIDPKGIDHLSEWHLATKGSAWDACKPR